MKTVFSGPMVYTLFPCFPRKMVYTIAFFCSVTSGSGDRLEKEGCHGGGVYSLFFLRLWRFQTLGCCFAPPYVRNLQGHS